jgi:hypothetical protein
MCLCCAVRFAGDVQEGCAAARVNKAFSSKGLRTMPALTASCEQPATIRVAPQGPSSWPIAHSPCDRQLCVSAFSFGTPQDPAPLQACRRQPTLTATCTVGLRDSRRGRLSCCAVCAGVRLSWGGAALSAGLHLPACTPHAPAPADTALPPADRHCRHPGPPDGGPRPLGQLPAQPLHGYARRPPHPPPLLLRVALRAFRLPQSVARLFPLAMSRGQQPQQLRTAWCIAILPSHCLHATATV